MCRPTRCRTCGKTTWAGCGQHVASVKAGVPADQWCPGHPASTSSAQPTAGSLLRRLFRL
ncbi:hypothetical protein [Nocardioides sp. J54]|uniref:hypothetical protein n=1 Tax=Nocardioides sp. J54 TaxID=935866 RepID=UPI00048DFA20|nr:hypothetical protein [Nocardioides sp. J54]